MQNIDKLLSFEIKKEIADRYFGFRKLIEEDTKNYEKEVKEKPHELLQKISRDLLNISSLLKSRQLTDEFIKTCRLSSSPEIRNILAKAQKNYKPDLSSFRPRGFTRKGRFRNLLFELYQKLYDDIEAYQKLYKKLKKERDTIKEEINLFYKKNDINIIMDFMRNLNGPTNSYGSDELDWAPGKFEESSLHKNMKIEPPAPIEETIPSIPSIPPLKEIKTSLAKIADSGWIELGKPDAYEITR